MPEHLLTRLEQFTRLSAVEREALRGFAARRWEVGAREDIAHEGDGLGAARIVLRGWACRYKQLEDGRRQIAAILLPGDLCDTYPQALTTMDHSIGALTPVVLAEVAPERLAEVAARHPGIAVALSWQAQVATSIQREWTVNIGQREAPERLGHLFCELHERLRRLGLAQDDGCEMPLRQADMAEATGLTSVHVNRCLQMLRGRKLIALKGRRLTIPDLDRLRRASMFDPNYLHARDDHACVH